MIVSRSSAIAAARVKMVEAFPGPWNGCFGVILLNVHVECVEMNAKCRTSNVLYHANRLFAGIDEVSLKTIQRLNGNLFAFLISVLASFFQILDHQLPLGLPLFFRYELSTADNRINRSYQNWRLKHIHSINQVVHVIQRSVLFLGCPPKITPRPECPAQRAAY